MELLYICLLYTSARDANVKRFIYAASSSTYGDSQSLPKVEDVIGKPLSPYAITKYVNELHQHGHVEEEEETGDGEPRQPPEGQRDDGGTARDEPGSCLLYTSRCV